MKDVIAETFRVVMIETLHQLFPNKQDVIDCYNNGVAPFKVISKDRLTDNMFCVTVKYGKAFQVENNVQDQYSYLFERNKDGSVDYTILPVW